MPPNPRDEFVFGENEGSSAGITGVGGRAGPSTTSSTSGGGASAMGGASVGGSGQGVPLGVDDLRFSILRAGRDDYCGITRDDRRLVCVKDDEVSFELEWPIAWFDMNDQAPVWDTRCAVLESGELSCFGECFRAGS